MMCNRYQSQMNFTWENMLPVNQETVLQPKLKPPPSEDDMILKPPPIYPLQELIQQI
jgi:hypothetical protein